MNFDQFSLVHSLSRVRATPKSPPTRRGPLRGTPRVPAPLPLSTFSPPDRDRRGDSPACWEQFKAGGEGNDRD